MFGYPVQSPVTIPDLDGRAFELLLRYMYNSRAEIRSTDTAISTLYVANMYLCIGLMTECINYLEKNLHRSNCLEVYQHARLYCGHRASTTPSAPPQDAQDREEFSHGYNMCAELLQTCSRFIDSNADAVLCEEGIEDLPADCLREILEKDTLKVSSETVVYQAVERWASSQCKRLRLELTHENRRSVVSDDLLFTVRFLLMNEKEFCSGPMSGHILTQAECQALLGHILKIPDIPSVQTLTDENVYKICRQRVRDTGDRSHSNAKKKNNKKLKKDQAQSSTDKCSSSCALDYMVRGLACLFD